jgi:hypothetical protein
MKHYGDGSKRFVYNILSKNLYEKNILPHVVKKGSDTFETISAENDILRNKKNLFEKHRSVTPL